MLKYLDVSRLVIFEDCMLCLTPGNEITSKGVQELAPELGGLSRLKVLALTGESCCLSERLVCVCVCVVSVIAFFFCIEKYACLVTISLWLYRISRQQGASRCCKSAGRGAAVSYPIERAVSQWYVSGGTLE